MATPEPPGGSKIRFASDSLLSACPPEVRLVAAWSLVGVAAALLLCAFFCATSGRKPDPKTPGTDSTDPTEDRDG